MRTASRGPNPARRCERNVAVGYRPDQCSAGERMFLLISPKRGVTFTSRTPFTKRDIHATVELEVRFRCERRLATMPLDTSRRQRRVAERLRDPEYRDAYERAAKEIAQVDDIIRQLDARRVEVGMSKAQLARHIGKESSRAFGGCSRRSPIQSSRRLPLWQAPLTPSLCSVPFGVRVQSQGAARRLRNPRRSRPLAVIDSRQTAVDLGRRLLQGYRRQRAGRGIPRVLPCGG